MNLKFRIELYQTGKKASLYTVKIEGEKESEFDNFLSDPEIISNPEFRALLVHIDEITNKYGCQERFFKLKESKLSDAVSALWRGQIRLYCCRYSNIILILGSGGIKSTATYQEDPKLNRSVEIMAEVSNRMDQRIRGKSIIIKGNKFEGNLYFGEE